MSAELRVAIEQAQNTQQALVSATKSGDAYDEKELIRLRKQFQADMLAISQISRSDVGLKSDPARHAEFKKRHRETQDQLSRHQATWMLRDIERNRDGYDAATTALRKAQDAFFDWAKAAI